ncbi:hypothetical protein Tco_1254302 [Tanacetum coccineum]
MSDSSGDGMTDIDDMEVIKMIMNIFSQSNNNNKQQNRTTYGMKYNETSAESVMYRLRAHCCLGSKTHHEKTNPDIYTPPKAKRLVIEELDAEPIISKAGITPVARKLVLDVNNNQTCGKEKGKSSGKDLEGQSSAVGNDGSYEESQDPNFDPFADLDLILPTMGDMEGNTSEHVDLGDETNNVEIECDDDRHGEEHTRGDHEIHDEEERRDEYKKIMVDDVDVDMKDFDFHVDKGVEFMGCRDIEQTVDIEEGDG